MDYDYFKIKKNENCADILAVLNNSFECHGKGISKKTPKNILYYI